MFCEFCPGYGSTLRRSAIHRYSAIARYMTKTSVKKNLAPQMLQNIVFSDTCGKFCPVYGVIFQNFSLVIGTYFQNVALVMDPNSEFSKAYIYS